MQQINIPQMVTINEAAKLTGIAKYRVRQLALENKIKNVRAGRKILINLEKFIEYLNESTGIDEDISNSFSNRFNIRQVKV